MRVSQTAPITIQPWPLPHDHNTGIVPPWLQYPIVLPVEPEGALGGVSLLG